MFKDNFFFILKTICLTYILSFWVLPILCGSVLLTLMVTLLKRISLMGLNCIKDNDRGQRERNTFYVNNSEPVLTQPRANMQTPFQNMPNQRNNPAINPRDLQNRAIIQTSRNGNLQSVVSREVLPNRTQVKKKLGANTRWLFPGEPRSSVSNKTSQNLPKKTEIPHWVHVQNRKRNQKPQEEPQPVRDLDNIETASKAKRYKQSAENEKILLKFEENLRKGYREQYAGRKPSKFWLDVHMRKDSGVVNQRLCTLGDLFPEGMTKWKMLVYGLPRFGKSQLCRDLTLIWVSVADGSVKEKYANFRAFRFWILFELSEGSVVNLEKNIVGKCYNSVHEGKMENYFQNFQNAWRSQMGSTMIVLDGFDNLNQKQKQHVKSVIHGNSFFDGASFLLTCRPNNDSELGKWFSIQADICGLSEMTLTHWIGEASCVSETLSCKIKELCGVSPFHAQIIGKVCSETKKPLSLYELVDRVVHMILKNAALNKNEIHVLGQFLVRRLKYRKFTFKQSELPELLQEKCELLLECNIFNECSTVYDGQVSLIVSHMIFMLYFCVRYLQEECDKLASHRDRIKLFKQNLLFENVSEEYYTSVGNPLKKYLVGLVPEIVFETRSKRYEMVSDVEDSKLSSAFETQRLLLRADKKRLEMFGIAEVEESLLQDSFVDLLNMLDFSDLTTVQSYFMQMHSSLRFFKLLVNDEENEKLVMSSVASSNKEGQIQDIFIEFKVSDMKQLSLFLQKLAGLFFGLCQLDTNNGGPEFIMSLGVSALKCSSDCYTRLALCPDSRKANSLFSWEIVSSYQNEPCSFVVFTDKNSIVKEEFGAKQCQGMIKNPHYTPLIKTMEMYVGDMDQRISAFIKPIHS